MNGKKISLGLLLLVVALVVVPGASAYPNYYGVLQSIYGGPTSCQYDCHNSAFSFTKYGDAFKAQPNHGGVLVGGTGTYDALIAIGPPLATITVAPGTASLTVGGTQTYTAATLDPFSNQIIAPVTWKSSNTAVGTFIDPNTGVFTASGSGTATLTATGGGSGRGTITGTATATVSAPVQRFSVTFTVNSSTGPLRDASVVMDGIKKKTLLDGTATFTNVANGDHKYTVSMRGYKRASGIVTVNNADASKSVQLTPR